MNIKQIQNVIKLYNDNKVNKTARTEKTTPAMQKDEVILSSHAQEVGQIYQGIKSSPEVREAKINDLSRQISAGTYQVDSRDIAAKMIQNAKNNLVE